ncbi:MAG: export transporter permease LptF, partial [Pseudomonadota bacterium]
MLFDSSIRKDLARNFWASSLVLFAIVMTLVLIRTLDLADRGKFNPEEITLALGYSSLSRLPTILAVTLLVAVVSVLSRMYRDSEIPIWQGAGMGLWHLVKPLVKFAWPLW